MPVEPPPSRWQFDEATGPRADPDDDLVASAPTSSRAPCWRRTGTGCSRCRWAAGRADGLVVAGTPRGAAARRRWSSRARCAARAATSRCASTRRSPRCSTPAPTRGARTAGSTSGSARAYLRLHELGWAHSVEAWRDGRLEGGLYGLAIGGLFAGESMFHRARDASKAALVGLVDLLRDEHADRAAGRRPVGDRAPAVARGARGRPRHLPARPARAAADAAAAALRRLTSTAGP